MSNGLKQEKLGMEHLNKKTNVMATVFPADQLEPREELAPATVYWDTGLEPDLQYLYDTIGCRLVECVRLPDGDLWVDENGLLNGSPFNTAANEFCQQQGEHLSMQWYIVGTAVFIPRDNRK